MGTVEINGSSDEERKDTKRKTNVHILIATLVPRYLPFMSSDAQKEKKKRLVCAEA